jgi:hypothetical protein
MPEKNKKRTKRIRSMVVLCTLTAIILTVSTYAWFIGMRTVNVSSFDVEIVATDSLLLSFDGETWDTTVAISKDDLEDVSYEGHTNSWGGEGLIPMSSIGDMDSTASRMKLFEKASLTATKGGYRLMASRVHNYEEGNDEQNGYVAFDLFIKNFSGKQYIAQLNELDEEAIYLTTDSIVKVADTGGVANTGIENSVRVAFAQIGRVVGTTTTPSTITGITCTTDGEVTGICRKAQIWEPNDKAHVTNAISWYNTACRPRIAEGEDVTDPDSYNTAGTCGAVANTTAYPTYAVSKDITSADNVDVYDGPAYNSYEGSGDFLVSYPYFTDTMKNLKGTSRPTFMTLAPNSITKVRIYIYIEGQDVDNYDFASIGKKISVAFGFTKERFNDEDIHYTDNEGPNLNGSEKPDIVLLGDSYVTIVKGSTYVDAGAVATDNKDDDTVVTGNIVTVNPVDTATAGTYTVTYNVTDSDGNAATEVTRTVKVINADTTKPVITLLGNRTVSIAKGATYNDAGAIATDNVDNKTLLTRAITTTSTVDTATAGTYTVTYNVTDTAGNAAVEVTRTVIVTE